MQHDRRNHGSKSEQVADHAYFKIGAPMFVAGLLALVVFFLKGMNDDFKQGLSQINTNITAIAVNEDNIEDNAHAIESNKTWLRNLSIRVRSQGNPP